MSQTERIVSFDLLRISAIVAVVFIHASGILWYDLDPHSFAWQTCNFYDSLARWGVPVFVMISGALFLRDEYEIKIPRLYRKNILRIITAFIFWSLVYSTYHVIVDQDFSKLNFVKRFIKGEYHLWFLFLIVGLYIVAPLIKLLVQHEKLVKYFLVLAFVISFLGSSLAVWCRGLISATQNHVLTGLYGAVSAVLGDRLLYTAFGYAAYFVLGHYLARHTFSKRVRIVLYLLGGLGFLYTVLATSLASILAGAGFEGFYNYIQVSVACESVAVFVFIRQCRWEPSEKAAGFIAEISSLIFGIYLIHALILAELFRVIALLPPNYLVLMIPLAAVVTLAISTLVIYPLSKVRWLKRHIM